MTAKERSTVSYLERLMDDVERASRYLVRSVKISEQSLSNIPPTDEDIDHFEAFTARFARLSDLLTQKLLRVISALELSEPGTTLDVLNQAAKKGLIESEELGRRIRLLRNEIAHEYAVREPVELAKEVIVLTPLLLDWANRSLLYSEKLIERLR